MASYKDITPSKFSPYVPTRPVEAMMRVGMYKQQKFDEGLKKIQDNIDNVAGLDVVRPEDKEYLQSKLNQLGGQISNMAGGDFSNFSLVNSVNGMTNQIVKDPAIMNAVSNTARYKKDLTTVDKLQSEGEWAPSNQAAFQTDVNNWFQGGQDATYNANVSPYVNVTKDATEIVEALAKKYTQNDVAVETDKSGRVTGVYDAITRTKIEGVTRERIATALQVGLSPQAWRQLSIDGKYRYSNTSPEQFVSDVNSTYQSTFLNLASDRQMLTESLSSLSPSEQTKANEKINEIDNRVIQLQEEYDSVSSGFEKGEVENAKAQYYTTNWIDNISNSYSSQSKSVTYHTSPWKTQENFERKLAKDEERWQLDYQLKLAEYNRKVLKDKKDNEPIFESITLPTGTDEAEKSDAEIMNIELEKTKASIDLTKSLKLKLDRLGVSEDEIDNPSSIVDENKRNLVYQHNQAQRDSTRLVFRDRRIEEMADRAFPLPSEDQSIQNVSNSSDFIIGNDGVGSLLYHTIEDEEGTSINVNDLATMMEKFERLYPRIVNPKFYQNLPGAKENFFTDLKRVQKDLTGIERIMFDNLYLVSDTDIQGDPASDIPLGYSTMDESSFLSRRNFEKYISGAERIKNARSKVKGNQDSWKEQMYVNRNQINSVSAETIDKKNFSSVLNVLGELNILATSADSDMLSTGISSSDITDIIEDGVKSASLYTDFTGGQQGLIVNGVKIPVPEQQFSEFTRDRLQPTPQMKFYNEQVLPLLIDTLPEEILNSEGETVLVDRDYYSTSLDNEYNTSPMNSAYSTKKGDFPQLKDSYTMYLNFNTMNDPKDTNSVVAQMLVIDPLDNTPKTLNRTIATDKISEFFNLGNSNSNVGLEQLIYYLLNERSIKEGNMPANINDNKEYKLKLEMLSKELSN